MNWDDASSRARLIETVGPDEYNRQFLAHVEASTAARVNGYRIRPVGSRFGRLFMVDGTGTAFRTLEQASDFARQQPTKVN